MLLPVRMLARLAVHVLARSGRRAENGIDSIGSVATATAPALSADQRPRSSGHRLPRQWQSW